MNQVAKMLQAGYADLNWMNANLQSIKREHDEQFIAVNKGKVVASATSMEVLMRELKKKKVDAAKTLITYVSKVKDIL